MRGKSWKRWAIEGWAFSAVAAIAFVGGLLIGDLGSSPKSEIVYVPSPAGEGEEAGTVEPADETTAAGTVAGEAAAGEAGAQVFTSASCGTCHTLAAAGSTGQTGPDLNEFLAPDDNTKGVEEMIVDPNSELAEGYPANLMPQNYGETLSKAEVHQLAEYLVATTPANK